MYPALLTGSPSPGSRPHRRRWRPGGPWIGPGLPSDASRASSSCKDLQHRVTVRVPVGSRTGKAPLSDIHISDGGRDEGSPPRNVAAVAEPRGLIAKENGLARL